jgi:four helix bundle protein
MQMIRNFEDLKVWQEAHQLTLDVYKATEAHPQREQYGLASQMRRAAVSVPANIAEGFGRKSEKEKVNFYNIAQGSLSELKYYFILARDLGFQNSTATPLENCNSMVRMLHNLNG